MSIGFRINQSASNAIAQQVADFLASGGQIEKAEHQPLVLHASLRHRFMHLRSGKVVTEYDILKIARDIESQFGRQGAEFMATSLTRRGYKHMSGRSFNESDMSRMFGLK